jgi:hypothetical protein
MEKIASSFGFSDFFSIGPKGRAGGICMLWSNSVDMKVLKFNPNLMAITIRDAVCEWTLVGFYGPPHKTKRKKAWINLHGLLESVKGSWVVFGDFNVIVDDIEKDGGKSGDPSTPSFLKELLFDLGAVDLGFSGNRFTWSNRRWGKNCIRERLDKDIANISWRLAYPRASVFHLEAVNSNHCPLLLIQTQLIAKIPDLFALKLFGLETPDVEKLLLGLGRRSMMDRRVSIYIENNIPQLQL